MAATGKRKRRRRRMRKNCGSNDRPRASAGRACTRLLQKTRGARRLRHPRQKARHPAQPHPGLQTSAAVGQEQRQEARHAAGWTALMRLRLLLAPPPGSEPLVVPVSSCPSNPFPDSLRSFRVTTSTTNASGITFMSEGAPGPTHRIWECILHQKSEA